MTTHEQVKANLVLSSKAIFTGSDDAVRAGALAITGNRITAIGSKEEIEKYIGPDTQVYDYGDQLIMPGFHDFHLHLLLGSLYHDCVNLLTATSEEEAALMVKQFADSRPEDPWVFGFSWYHVYWKKKQLPHRATLDRLIPDRPVFLFNAECHGAWLNSKALEILNITRDTADPPFGHIERDDQGEPTGFLYETAMGLAREAFQLPDEQKNRLFRGFLKQAGSLGITSINDFFPLPGMELGDLDLYQSFEASGELSTRIHFLAALDGNLDRPRYLRKQYTSGKLMFSGLKQFLDGVPTTYTALLVDPYSDRPDSKGDTLIPPETVKKWVVEADKEDFRVRLHACGDGAVRLGLDCFEAARVQNGIRDSRHTIEHIEVIHPDDIQRMSHLQVIASMQPEHMAAAPAFPDNCYPNRFGKERDPYTWPIKTLLKNEVSLAFGSDFPIVPLDPMTEIYRAVTRLHDDHQPEGGWNPQEKITMAEALRAYTSAPAYGVFREHELGKLAPGMLADIVVLDRNLFAIEPPLIRDAKALLTITDGKIVFNRGEPETSSDFSFSRNDSHLKTSFLE
ncbi:amidohydrolase [Brevibacillus reuszeri]|uniref:amidohydrolase n=1 Tax=Brevibacillus reuszeri TaxID=54915 RepID=UPI00289E9CE8|nr:amidohydrolase [Brevibacillus reuszeri]